MRTDSMTSVLSVQSPVGELFRKIRRCGPVEAGVLLGMSLEVSQAQLSLCVCGSGCSSQLQSSTMHAAMVSAMAPLRL